MYYLLKYLMNLAVKDTILSLSHVLFVIIKKKRSITMQTITL